MTNQPQQSDDSNENARGWADAMSPGPGTPPNAQEEEHQREVAETVNPGPNSEGLGMDELTLDRELQGNPGSPVDRPEEEVDPGSASRMNLGPQE